jgi:hypothetical protein
MKLKSSSRRKRNNTKSMLHLPDLEHAKAVRIQFARALECIFGGGWAKE